MRFALAHSKFYPFPPLPPPTNVGSLVCIMATTRFHIFLYAISARQPTLQGGGRGGERMRLCIYQKFPLYPMKLQFPILSQNNYSMIEVDKCSQHSASEISTKISIYQEILVCRRFEYIGVKSYQYTTWESFSIFHVCRLVFNEWSYQSSNKHAFCYLCASNTATVDICNKGAYAETNLCPTHKRNINFTLLFLHLNQQINIS